MSTSTEARQPRTLCTEHLFHIPVMGTGFSIDTPLRVAKYGIASVVSLVDDILIEQVHAHHAAAAGTPIEPLAPDHPDPRASRITAYLDFLDASVEKQIAALRVAPFEPGSEITRYFELLPETPLKRLYRRMLQTPNASDKARLQQELRSRVHPGSIDVNIMTKLDATNYRNGQPLPPEHNDGMAALRGYALSTLDSSIVFSAGMNARLYGYIDRFADFQSDASGHLRKRVVLKVSDFRSAAVQGRFLAKRGVWVSEFRVESGLNCGGHAFATPGYLMGPIIEEFKQKRDELLENLHAAYNETRLARGLAPVDEPHRQRLTAQGGIGSLDEQELLVKYYQVDGTGWGTPFLLAPDVTNVDDDLMERLLKSDSDSVFLSDSSPMGVPFWSLRTSPSEESRRQRIAEGHPGTPCPKGYIRNNTTYTKQPVCVSSRDFQRRCLSSLDQEQGDPAAIERRRTAIQGKACICHELGGSVMRKLHIEPAPPPAVCPGPNLAYFRHVTNLDELVGHIYGRLSLLCGSDRPHMFIQELKLYIEHFRGMLEDGSAGLLSRTPKQVEEFARNLMDGIRYYQALSRQIVRDKRDRFVSDLAALQKQLERLLPASLDTSN